MIEPHRDWNSLAESLLTDIQYAADNATSLRNFRYSLNKVRSYASQWLAGDELDLVLTTAEIADSSATYWLNGGVQQWEELCDYLECAPPCPNDLPCYVHTGSGLLALMEEEEPWYHVDAMNVVAADISAGLVAARHAGPNPTAIGAAAAGVSVGNVVAQIGSNLMD